MDLENEDIFLIEDLVDSGRTIHALKKELKKLNYKSLTIITLLSKPNAIKYTINVDFNGFEIENDFIIGHGIDYNEGGRNLTEIYQKKR